MKKPQSHRLRTGRVSEPNQPYLITTVTHNRLPLFTELTLARLVVHALYHHEKTGHIESLAYVLMPDHLHWLVKLEKGATLSSLMRSFKGYTSRRINDHRNTHGVRCWQPGFHDHALRSEEDLTQIARYIVANPLRAGLVDKLGDYPLWDAVWL